jgi:anti-sigma regulatory factor (Ser/Thr protein kinase)
MAPAPVCCRDQASNRRVGVSSKSAERLLSEPSSFWQRHRVRSFQQFRDELRQFFEQRGIPAEVSTNLVLATQEACNNACQHGARNSGCDVSVSFVDGTITIEVADDGRGFDFESVKATWPPMLLRSGGRGLYLIAELTDQLEVIQRRPGTLVRIFKVIE